MDRQLLIDNIREVPDYPKKGITFFDITTLFKNPRSFKEAEDALYEYYKDKGITKVAGIEARGFVMGAALASRLGAGFVLVRKEGKLPAETIKCSYNKEYGGDVIGVHKDAITPDDVVLVHDDILATGGTAAAAIKLVGGFNPKAVLASFIIEIEGLGGKALISDDIDVYSLLNLSE